MSIIGLTSISGGGFICLKDRMGTDATPAETARIFKPSKTGNSDENLVRYMMRHQHTTPFEFIQLVFWVKAPIFVARQWFRHRTWSFTEFSLRYSEAEPNGFRPEGQWRAQAESNHQGSDGWTNHGINHYGGRRGSLSAEEVAFDEYQDRLRDGVAKEQARSCLPLSTWTEFAARVDMHNLLKFLALRLDSHAQVEIREYAQAIHKIVKGLYPVIVGAWEEYQLNSITLTAKEVALASGEAVEIEGRQLEEATKKLARINLRVVNLGGLVDKDSNEAVPVKSVVRITP